MTGGYTSMNTLQALERLAAGPRSAPELARELTIGLPTSRRILNRLVAEGYAVREGGHRHRYRSTLRLLAVGVLQLQQAKLVRTAARALGELAVSGATAHLWIAAIDGPPLSVLRVAAASAASPLQIGPVPDEMAGSAAAVVLDADRVGHRSCAVIVDDGRTAVAASVIDHGRVTAAVGVRGVVGLDVVAAVDRVARAVGQQLEHVGRQPIGIA